MPYTDYFGQTLAVGDEIIYPESSGTNRAYFARYTIDKIIELIPHRSQSNYLMRADQAGKEHATPYAMPEDPDKWYVVQVMKKSRWDRNPVGRRFTIRFIDNIVKVPDA